MKSNPLIIALDTPSTLKAVNLVQRLKVTGVAFKIGLELFCAAGPRIVKKILNHHVRVFLDLKLHDIPNTVARAAAEITEMGVWMMTVHASGGSGMMVAAREASLNVAERKKITPPKIVGVTVLTSLASLDEFRITQTVGDQVLHLAGLVKKSGLDGVVASGREARALSQKCGSDFCLVTPGIRLPTDLADDQRRTMTPREALDNGSHYLVIGRPVTESLRPLKAVDQILSALLQKNPQHSPG